MAQLFGPNTNTYAKVSLLLAAGAPLTVFYLGSTITRSSYNTHVGIPLDQPIPFSHKHHAFELGIDCRFCHTSVEEGAIAGLPTTEVCMTCHSQVWTNSPLLAPLREGWESGVPIEWVKVNRVPDFVYFDHSIHIVRGINCNTCHGPVQQMQITFKGQTFHMSWCLECHRNPEKFMYEMEEGMEPRAQVFELYSKLSRGEKLTPFENAMKEGRYAHVPDDIAHEGLVPSEEGGPPMSEGVRLMKERKVAKAELTDCWVCHR